MDHYSESPKKKGKQGLEEEEGWNGKKIFLAMGRPFHFFFDFTSGPSPARSANK